MINTQNDFFLVSHADINAILSENIATTYKIIKNAYLAHENGYTVVPESNFLFFPDNPQSRIIALPGYIAEEFNISGIKWIASNPQNLQKGLPRASGVIILNHAVTGRPFACLEGSLISMGRTAASAVLAAEYMHLHNKKVANLGIVGNGPIAMEIYRYFINTGWNIKELTLFDLQVSASQTFQSKIDFSNHNMIHIVESTEKLMMMCDVIVFATTSSKPYLHDLELIKHNPLILHVSLRDLSPEILLNSHNVVDDISHVLHANTSPHLAEQMTGHSAFIDGTIGGLIKKQYKLSSNKTRIFSPMGLGILDLALAKYVFENAYATERHISIKNFLPQTGDLLLKECS